MLLLVRSSAEPLTDAEVRNIRFELATTFKNSKFTGVPSMIEETRAAYAFYVDLLLDDGFPFDTRYFLERIGLDPSTWKLVMELP